MKSHNTTSLKLNLTFLKEILVAKKKNTICYVRYSSETWPLPWNQRQSKIKYKKTQIMIKISSKRGYYLKQQRSDLKHIFLTVPKFSLCKLSAFHILPNSTFNKLALWLFCAPLFILKALAYLKSLYTPLYACWSWFTAH